MKIVESKLCKYTSKAADSFLTYFKVRVDVFGNNVFGFGFVLTVDDVHVQLALVTFEQRTQFGHIFATFFDGLQEHTA